MMATPRIFTSLEMDAKKINGKAIEVPTARKLFPDSKAAQNGGITKKYYLSQSIPEVPGFHSKAATGADEGLPMEHIFVMLTAAKIATIGEKQKATIWDCGVNKDDLLTIQTRIMLDTLSSKNTLGSISQEYYVGLALATRKGLVVEKLEKEQEETKWRSGLLNKTTLEELTEEEMKACFKFYHAKAAYINAVRTVVNVVTKTTDGSHYGCKEEKDELAATGAAEKIKSIRRSLPKLPEKAGVAAEDFFLRIVRYVEQSSTVFDRNSQTPYLCWAALEQEMRARPDIIPMAGIDEANMIPTSYQDFIKVKLGIVLYKLGFIGATSYKHYRTKSLKAIKQTPGMGSREYWNLWLGSCKPYLKEDRRQLEENFLEGADPELQTFLTTHCHLGTFEIKNRCDTEENIRDLFAELELQIGRFASGAKESKRVADDYNRTHKGKTGQTDSTGLNLQKPAAQVLYSEQKNHYQSGRGRGRDRHVRHDSRSGRGRGSNRRGGFSRGGKAPRGAPRIGNRGGDRSRSAPRDRGECYYEFSAEGCRRGDACRFTHSGHKKMGGRQTSGSRLHEEQLSPELIARARKLMEEEKKGQTTKYRKTSGGRTRVPTFAQTTPKNQAFATNLTSSLQEGEIQYDEAQEQADERMIMGSDGKDDQTYGDDNEGNSLTVLSVDNPKHSSAIDAISPFLLFTWCRVVLPGHEKGAAVAVKLGNDTLANINIVGAHFFSQFPHMSKHISPSSKDGNGVVGVSGNNSVIRGKIDLDVKYALNTKLIKTTFYVNLSYQGSLLISYDTLRKLKAKIDCEIGTITYQALNESPMVFQCRRRDINESQCLRVNNKCEVEGCRKDILGTSQVTCEAHVLLARSGKPTCKIEKVTFKKVKSSVINFLLNKADQEGARLRAYPEGESSKTRLNTVLIGQERIITETEQLVKNTLGVTTIIIPGKGQQRKKVSKAMLDYSTVILPVTMSSPWFRDMQDHIVADPIPVPHTKPKLFVAVKFGTREENLEYRKGLLTRDLEQIRIDAFKVVGGRFRSDCFIQYAMLLDSIAQLATLDDFPEKGYDIKSGDQRNDQDSIWEEEDIPSYDDVLPQTDRKLNFSTEDILKESRKGGIEREFVPMVKELIEKHSDLFLSPRLGDLKDEFSCEVKRIPGKHMSQYRQQRLSHKEEECIKTEVTKLLEADMVEESSSDTVSKVRLVEKPDGSLRFCVNYYKLNKIIQDIKLGVPSLRDGVDRLREAQFMSTLDLKSGFHQLPIAETDRHLTAFMVGTKLYQWKVLPMGLKTAPGLFQKAMEKVLSSKYDDPEFVKIYGSTENYAFAYIDDIIIFSKSAEDHEAHLKDIMRRISAFGLKLNPLKCKFFQRMIQYLGYLVGNGKVRMSPAAIDKILNYERPTAVPQLHTFVAMVQHYSEFLKDFAEDTRLLWTMIRERDMEWNEQRARAFETLKAAISKVPHPDGEENGPVLILPDFEKEFHVLTDASGYALGGVLAQYTEVPGLVEEILKPVMFISRKLTSTEQKYSTRDREALGILWSVKRFRKYLYGTHFTVHTDHANLRWLMETEVTGRLARWATTLSNYDFTLKYIKGKDNVVADTMSRLIFKDSNPAAMLAMLQAPVSSEHIQRTKLSRNVAFYAVHDIDTSLHVLAARQRAKNKSSSPCECDECKLSEYEQMEEDDRKRYLKRLNSDFGGKPEAEIYSVQHLEIDGLKYPVMNERILRKETLEDNDMKQFIEYQKGLIPVTKSLSQMKETLKYHDGLVYKHKRNQGDLLDKDKWRVYVPLTLRKPLLILAHRAPLAGHPGISRTKSLIQDKFFWPKQGKDIEDYVKGCAMCKRAKTPLQNKKGFQGEYPLSEGMSEVIHVDHVGPLPETASGFKYILTAIDRATNHVIVTPVKDVTAETTAKALWDNVICRHGVPRKIISDRGPAFKNTLIAEFAKRTGFYWNYTSAYNPRANGKVERMHRVLKATLMSYCHDKPKEWESHLQAFAFAINNNTTFAKGGLTPNQCLFGQKLLAPLNLMQAKDSWADGEEMFVRRQTAIAETQALLQEKFNLEQLKQSREVDNVKRAQARHIEYKEGDMVLLYSPAIPKGVSGKLFPQWSGPYYVVKRTAAYNYNIKNARKYKDNVHVRRLIKYDPYLFENETLIDALERDKKDFNDKESKEVLTIPPTGTWGSTLSEENDDAEEIKNHHGEKGVKKSSAVKTKRVTFAPGETSGKSTRKTIPRAKGYQFELNKFYLVKLNNFSTLENVFWLVQVKGVKTHSSSNSNSGSKQKVTAQFYRCRQREQSLHETKFLPAWLDTRTGLEDYRLEVDIKKDTFYEPIMEVLDIEEVIYTPFDLDGQRIPLRIWDEVKALGISPNLIGGPSPTKFVRAKKKGVRGQPKPTNLQRKQPPKRKAVGQEVPQSVSVRRSKRGRTGSE